MAAAHIARHVHAVGTAIVSIQKIKKKKIHEMKGVCDCDKPIYTVLNIDE